MSTLTDLVPLETLLGSSTTLRLRPRYEGSNICTWIGFKHVNYLVEEGVLEHFRAAGAPARRLYEEHGLGLDLVELDTRIATALHMDDLATAQVTGAGADDGELRFAVTLGVVRDGATTKAASARVRVILRSDGPPADAPPAAPADARGAIGADPLSERLLAGRNGICWKWRMPYFYCHFTERVQMSGYLRQLEEVVDLFLAERGISIRSLLDERRWIPVVPHSRVRLLEDALMEEELYTVFTVEDVFKDLTYTARMECWVVRDGEPVQTAEASITHGYALIESRRDWSLVNFDERVLRALRGSTA